MAKLGDICTFQSGGTPSKSNSEYFNGSIPWITTVALTGDYIDKNDAVDWITDKAIQESAAKIVPETQLWLAHVLEWEKLLLTLFQCLQAKILFL